MNKKTKQVIDIDNYPQCRSIKKKKEKRKRKNIDSLKIHIFH